MTNDIITMPKLTRIEREAKLREMRNGKIERRYLLGLVVDYKRKRLFEPQFPMPRELAEVLLVIVDKTMGSASWRQYSDDWKEEFRGRAIEHVLKYAHNFNPIKSETGKTNDPYYYFSRMITNAFIQSWRKCKTYTDDNVLLNHDLLYNDNNWDGEQTNQNDVHTVTPNIDALDWGNFQ